MKRGRRYIRPGFLKQQGSILIGSDCSVWNGVRPGSSPGYPTEGNIAQLVRAAPLYGVG